MERKDRMAAVATALGINLILLFLLLRVGGLGSVVMAVETQRMQIRWMPRIAPVSPGHDPLPQPRSAVITDGQRTKKIESPAVSQAVPDKPMLIVADDDWGVASDAGAGIDFDALAMRRITGAPVPDKLEGKRVLSHMNFRDRSFGGSLQRMAQRMDCKELRAALNANPASADIVAETMLRRGCMR